MIITTIIAFLVATISYTLCYTNMMDSSTMCAVIMVAICLLPLRKFTALFVPWAIEYYCSRDSNARAKVRERWVTDPIDPDKKKFLNNGITLIGNAVIWVSWFAVALIFWVFKPLSVHSVTMMLYTISSFSYLLGSTAQIVGFVVWFILTIAEVIAIFLLYMAFRKNYNARKNGLDEPFNLSLCVKAFLVLFVIRKVYTYPYYGMAVQEILVDILVWWTIPTIYVLLESAIRWINHLLNIISE